MNNKVLPYSWSHAKLAYECPRIKTSIPLIMESEYVFFENETDFGYVAIYDDHVIISFKGTNNPKGWISNLDPYPLRKEEYLKENFKDGKWGRGIIHDGFYTSWLFFKPCINKIIESYHINDKEKQVIVTGHSRGGALAELCARHMSKNLEMTVSCITFGAPAVGIKKYRDQFRSLPINGTRVVNGWDIVPTLPPKIMGFKHGCANLFWIRKSFWKKFIPSIRIGDHYVESYEKAINKRFLIK